DAAERRRVGGLALERDGIPARLLPQVSPLREVLSPLGTGDLPPRSGMTERPLPLALRPLDAIGRWAIAGVEALGRFGPFLGRAGSALTAEIGIMRITEQIDALTVMALSPIRYLVAPSILAGLVTFPLMTALFDAVGIFGGYLVGVELLGLSQGTYFGEMQSFVDLSDIMTGFWKSLSFGVIVTWVCTYKGFTVGHGAEGVAKATTDAVVLSSVLILVWDYFMGTVLP